MMRVRTTRSSTCASSLLMSMCTSSTSLISTRLNLPFGSTTSCMMPSVAATARTSEIAPRSLSGLLRRSWTARSAPGGCRRCVDGSNRLPRTGAGGTTRTTPGYSWTWTWRSLGKRGSGMTSMRSRRHLLDGALQRARGECAAEREARGCGLVEGAGMDVGTSGRRECASRRSRASEPGVVLCRGGPTMCLRWSMACERALDATWSVFNSLTRMRV
mmetsp:Transcript_41512/g.88564  ORF Transcript_41512/g.88564 Transcript_41512/m.88564 type:complete len:216 (-) Transcript_41512:294-941(-)